MSRVVVRTLRRSDFLRAGAVLILLLAVLPNLLYLGHRPLFGDHPIHTEAQAREHAAHCHLGPSTCSGQAPLGQSLLAPEIPPFSTPDTFLSIADPADPFIPTLLVHRPDKPPRLLA